VLTKLRTAPSRPEQPQEVGISPVAARRGRFEEALARPAFVSIDPDSTVARELGLRAVAKRRRTAGGERGHTQSRPIPQRQVHVAATCFEALAIERRRGAHWRSLAPCRPSPRSMPSNAALPGAVMDERDAVLSRCGPLPKLGKLVSDLVARRVGATSSVLEISAGARSVRGRGDLLVRRTVPDGVRRFACGTVFSPFTPDRSRSSGKSVAFAGLRDGTYMTLLVGGSQTPAAKCSCVRWDRSEFPMRTATQTLAATASRFPIHRCAGRRWAARAS